MSSKESQQVVNFDQLDETFPILIHSRNVVIHPSSKTLDNESKASNKITTTNMVDYSWEDRYTLGHLISYHQHTYLVAYVLSISNNYMIRILSEEHSARCLIKEFTGEITDIAFSKSRIPYIASIDINGSVKVNKVNISHENIDCQLILHIKSNPSIESVKSMKVSYSRVMWCWHNDTDQKSIDEVETVGTNISLLLGVVHGSTFEVMQIDTIESELLSQAEDKQYEPLIDRSGLQAISSSFQDQFLGSENLSDLFLPYLVYSAPGEDSKITSLAISSDAAAFAVGLRDGTVRFFTLDGSVSSGLKEAYSWRPFNGEAVWSLLFLDDCRPGTNIESFWCHVVVGGAFNRELKLFRCDKWDCIQTVSFQSPITPCLLSAHIDQSARYLIMSDIRRKALYVLELDSIDNGKTKLFKNVQEIVLTQPLLSFDINTITSTASSDGNNHIVMKMFTITKGAFQKMRVTYMTHGHRLDEILVDMSDGDGEHEPPTTPILDHVPVSTSLLTHVSSLPSANSSFQDPAIISTHMQSNAIALKSLPVEMPPALQQLFSGTSDGGVGVGVGASCDRKQCANDSGEESEDEASLVDLGIQNDIYKTYENTKFPVNANEECRFPSPPLDPNNGWHQGNISMLKSENQDNYKETTNNLTLSRLEVALEAQQKQMDTLIKAVQDLQKTTLENRNRTEEIEVRCNCKETVQMWTEPALREVNSVCQKVIGEQIDRRLGEILDVVSRMPVEINTRLDDVVRNKLTALESVTRTFLSELLYDKKFIRFMATTLSESIEKPLRAIYFDMMRKELVPALGKTFDKLFTDTRDVLGDGIKEIVKSMDDSNRVSMRSYEEKILSCITNCQKAALGDLDNKLLKIINDMGNSQVYLADGFNKQRDQIIKVNDSLKLLKDSINDKGNQNHVLGKGNPIINSQVIDQSAIREQNINRLLNSGNYSDALNEALNMTDMRLLLFVCERIKPQNVLSRSSQKSSVLQSSSILSLIQQLSRDFQDQFELKFDYLLDAILSLDQNDSAIRCHVGQVLKGVVRRLESYYEQETNVVWKDKITVLLRIVASRLDLLIQE